MRAKLLKGAGLLAAVAVFSLVCLTRSKAQPMANRPIAPVTTNWVGCLVVGKNDPLDQIARGLFPTSVQQVQIGLRSDGVVIWRSAPIQ
jgi:hypothetical protein